MPIIKPGFEEGFRARKTAASFARRAYYLANPEGRESAILLGKTADGITAEQAIQTMGGREAEYHEIIVAPSALECQAIRERSVNPDSAERDAAHRLAQAYAGERPYVVAVHGSEDGRFHFHLTVPGPYPDHLDGEQGIMQKVWNENWVIQERRAIQNWVAWREFKATQVVLKEAGGEGRQLARLRRAELKDIPAEDRAQALARFREAELDLALKKAELERRSIEARFRAFGRSGSVFEAVELEQAGQRQTRALRQIEGRNLRADLEGAWGATLKEIRALRAQALNADPGGREAAVRTYQAAQGDLLNRHRQFEEACVQKEWQRSAGQDPRDLAKNLQEVARRFQSRVEQMELSFRLDEVRGELQALRAERGAGPGPSSGPEQVARSRKFEGRERALLEERRDLRVRILEADMASRGRLGSPEHRRHLDQLMEGEARLRRSESQNQLGAEIRGAQARMRDLRAELFPVPGQRPIGSGMAFEAIQKELLELSRRIMTLELARLDQLREERLAQGEAELQRARALRERCAMLEGQRLLEEAKAERARATELAGQGGHGACAEEVKGVKGDRSEALCRAIQLEVAALALLQASDPVRPGMQAAARDLPQALARLERDLASLDQRAAQVRARFHGVEIRQGLEGQVREVREGLQALQEEKRQALGVKGVDLKAIQDLFQAREAPLWQRLAALEERRLDSRFLGQAAGIGSAEHLAARGRLRDDQFIQGRIRVVRQELEAVRFRFQEGFGQGRPAELERLKQSEILALETIHQLQRTRVDLRHQGRGTLGSPDHVRELRCLDQGHAQSLDKVRARPVERSPELSFRVAKAVRSIPRLHGRDPHEVQVRAASAAGNHLLTRALARVPAVRMVASLVKSLAH